ncbi:MAG: ribonuclease III [Christensenellales bacterium]|jgi:ribonuclease-3
MPLEDAIGYRFRDKALLKTALTHPSYGKDHGTPHYQRLEFLGDAVLELAVSQMLFEARPALQEGQMTFIRARLVREETLSEIALEIGLDREMRLSHGEELSGGREKPSILSDMAEAVIAAIYLDGGFESAAAFVRRIFCGRIAEAVKDGGLDAKSRLQILLEKRQPGLRPMYTIVSQEGPPHDSVFTCHLFIEGVLRGEGLGKSKREAEIAAAQMTLGEMEG